MKKWEQLQLTLDNSKSKEGRVNYLDKTQICSRQWEFEFLNAIFYVLLGRYSKIVWFLACLQQGLYGVQSFEYSSYRESTECLNFQIFLLKFK